MEIVWATNPVSLHIQYDAAFPPKDDFCPNWKSVSIKPLSLFFFFSLFYPFFFFF